ncbi:hypothetical protein [Actinomadura parmotrematis]|uniref:MFS transporter n=1 Tax=Actinomadura parmotrematis TaxID=2864039 RepID=A0ABS7FY28_9ACTN|nr:hypothetical protein [Actinomadura parmotrematis]MBW8485345.1 hypothetical protein [Actinomadura parmotrematis]
MRAVGSLAVPVAVRRFRDQRPLVVAIVALSPAGFGGAAWAPVGSVWLWTVPLGLAQGAGCFIAAFGPLAVAILLLVPGLAAVRNRTIGAPAPAPSPSRPSPLP